MANIATQRIQREFSEVTKSDESQKNLISIELVNNSLSDLRGYISGPPDTPYEGGIFHLDIKIPETYPFNPPKVRFLTKIWHPNISSVTGAICLDILKDQWAAAMTIRTVLLSLQALLSGAEPDDPQDAVVAKQYKDSYEMFKLTAKHWTSVYAMTGFDKWRYPDFDYKIQRLMEIMKVDEDRARVALSSNNWDLEKATQSLLS
ncbi:ubiquitin-conjugating enzyme E2-22 kDa-like protein [Dinothrombium tinctorium]|uniref:Ubiquitin-conjugating enzyme E2-22 kDa-like protein n=1 Tax=Dinothrombium tinctorium TaxID=1965070 RepID=A0A3S3S4U2_9ACAR|nr:ubiquitin-conjugating enzyme E2-22 kDa-like protein [Dinothrombium tinctorium]RWS10388.1 ubiquitin-conjugating enzyme E2-22 kDa-like protein [Dinothrombium tinctorium]RWS11229.1 ubiquitin-conjugating enzyme E2-22 kDa-like protein [Dinothrombium tinctorium]